MAVDDLKAALSGLTDLNFRITSPADPFYNCIAWAAGENSRWWWPSRPFFWPFGIERSDVVAAFVAAFGVRGFAVCADGDLETGFEKVVIFADRDGAVTHMARQLPSGKWTSKCGQSEDIEHDELRCICGDAYGQPAAFLKRYISASSD